MPAKPLNPEQKADASRLRGVWEAFKRSNPEATQEWLADQCGWKTQAAVSQYLLGKIPLNLRALMKFAAVLKVSPDEISPSLMSEMPATVPRREKLVTGPGRSRLQKALEGLDDSDLLSIAKTVEILRQPRGTKTVRQQRPRTSKGKT